MSDLLLAGVAELGLVLSDQQISRLKELLRQLLKWNQAFNLTAVDNEADVVKVHLLDSLSIVPHWRFETTIDVGTGGGFPGLPLAIALPDQQFHLLDSNGKKVRFIRQQIHHLQLTNVEVFHSRVQQHTAHTYDAVVSRAFASLSDMVNMSRHLLKPGGRWMAMKGAYLESETDDLPEWIGEVIARPLRVPKLDAERCLIELKQRND